MLRHKPTKIALALLSAIAILSGCGGDDAASSLASAKSYLAKNDNKSAVIQLKNALQKNPDLGEARFLLGKSYLNGGEVASAVSELRRASDLKYPDAQVLPLLAKAMLTQGQTKKVIEQFAAVELTDPQANADLQTSVAVAYGTQNEPKRARAAVDKALAAVPGYPAALRMQARLLALDQKYDEAIELVDKIIAAAPNDPDAWHAKGDFLMYGKSNVPAAIDAYRHALTAKPDFMVARSSLITVLLAKHDLKAAEAEIAVMQKTSPRHPQTAYFLAQLAYFNNDFKRAREITQQLIRLTPDNVPLLQLAGAVELKLRLLLEAERSLSRALQVAPDLPLARRLLAQTYLQMGQPAKALETLEPLLSAKTPDAEASSLAAEANLQSGDLQQAEANFSRAAALNPQDLRSRVALALSKMNKGKRAEGVAEIQALAATDKGTFADLTLVSIYVRDKDFDRALAAIQKVEAKQPNSPMASNLRGRVYVLSGDTAKARGAFERALAISPAFVPAASSLALLDLADKHPETARKRFESVLASDPKNIEALMAIAGLRVKAGAPSEEIVGLLRNAIKLNPTEPAPRVLLVEHYLDRKDAKSALAAAQEAVGAAPNSPQVLDALGRAQLAGGDMNQAMSSFNKLTTLDARSPLGFMRLGGVQLAQKDVEGAIQSVKRALEIAPDMQPAQRMLAELQVMANRPQEALTIARAMQKQRPDDPVGYALEGSIEVTRKNLPAAANVYRAALKKFPTTDSANRVHSVLAAMGKDAEAEQFASTWISAHPKDAAFVFHLGEAALSTRNFAVAESRFKDVLRIAPDNAAALNNIAWIMTKLNKPGAVEYAQKATTLKPDSPSLFDTLATAYAAENKLPQAVDAQKKAIGLDPGNPMFRLNLAKIHIQAGDKAKARVELEAVTNATNSGSLRAEADQMMKSL
jgi:cellulose synthase operon protein C